MRCFIAIDVEDKLKERILRVQEGFKRLDVDVKFVEPENLHFTVKFIGNVNENEVNEIKRSLDLCLKRVKSFRINVHGVGYFGSKSNIRTLWLGVNKGEGEMVNVMKYVNDNVKFGEAKFSPHLTVGRIKSGRNRERIINLVHRERDVNVGEMYVKQVKLKVSELEPAGPKYSDLFVFNLEP